MTGRIFTYVCMYCGKPAEIKESRIAAISACPGCGQVLYEIDDQYRNIRVTRLFRVLYRDLLQALKEVRLISKDLEIQAKAALNHESRSSDDSAEVLLEKLQAQGEAIRTLSDKLLNENGFSDKDTQDSVSGAISLILAQSDRISNIRIQALRDPHILLEEVRILRSAEKEIFAFIRMLDKYLHEKSDNI